MRLSPERKGVTSLTGFNPLEAGICALGTGYLQKGIQGPPLQQEGVLVVGPGNIVHYLYPSQKAVAHPPIKEVLQACEVKHPLTEFSTRGAIFLFLR